MKLKLFVGIALIALSGPVQADKVDANNIIQSLAPITYLPEHGGKPKRAIDLAVTFRSGSANLTATARQILDQLGHALQSAQLKASRFEVAGHTDASGSRQLNKALSYKRAKAAIDYLTERYDIGRSRLILMYGGEESPMVLTASTEAQYFMNRRVEFRTCEKSYQEMPLPPAYKRTESTKQKPESKIGRPSGY